MIAHSSGKTMVFQGRFNFILDYFDCRKVAESEQSTKSTTLPRKMAIYSTIMTKDGTESYYKDWVTGEPVVFSHGWPTVYSWITKLGSAKRES